MQKPHNSSANEYDREGKKMERNGTGHESLWTRAYSNFKRQNAKVEAAYLEILGIEERTTFKTASSKQPLNKEQEMAQLIQRKIDLMRSREWRIKLGGKDIKIRVQMDRILKTLLFVRDLASQAASLDPIHAGLPVAGLAGLFVILSFVTGDKKNRDALFDGVEKISDMVRRYAVVEDIYLRDTERNYRADLEEAIVKLYEYILDFEARAVCQCSHNIASQTFRNLFAGSSWEDRLTSMNEAADVCERLLQVLDRGHQSDLLRRLVQINQEQRSQIEASAVESQEQLRGILDALEISRQTQEKSTEATEVRQCLTALTTSDYNSLKNQLSEREKDTCQWFLQHPQYLEWLRADPPALLWLTADPGCGKSVLAKYLVEDFVEITELSANVCYFFFKAGGESESGTVALSALLHQLFSNPVNESLLKKYGLPKYRLHGEKLGTLFEPQWEILKAVCRDSEREPIICVLDALDECGDSQREVLVTRFAKLISEKESVVNFKLLMTSRPDTRLLNAIATVRALQDFTFLQVEGDNEYESSELAREIDFVISEKIEQFQKTRKLRRINDKIHEEVRQKVFQIQNRTYLWVSLIFDELQKNVGASQDDLRGILETLPRTVEEVYEKILDRISTNNITKAKRILRTVLAAERDLRLQELKVAITVTEDGSSTKLDGRDETNTRIFVESIRSTCGLLIRVTASQVFLIHQTARDFLVKSLGQEDLTCLPWRNSFSVTEANLVLAQSCIWYLNSASFDQEWFRQDHRGQWKMVGPLSKYTREHPFFEYAARYWTLHLNQSGADDAHPLCAKASRLCEVDSSRYRAWSKLYWSSLGRGPPRSTTDLSVAAAFDLLPLMEVLIKGGRDIDGQDGDGDTALHSAALRGLERPAVALITWGASLTIKAHDGNSPLHSAAARGLAPVVKIMIQKGGIIGDLNLELRTPLHRAAQWGHPEVVSLLIDAGADVDMVDGTGRTPLHLAALFGREDIRRGHAAKVRQYSAVIKRLVGSGAEKSLVDHEGKTAFDLGVLTVAFFTVEDSDVGKAELGKLEACVRKYLRT